MGKKLARNLSGGVLICICLSFDTKAALLKLGEVYHSFEDVYRAGDGG